MAYSRLTDPRNRKYLIGGGIAIVAAIIVIVIVVVVTTKSTSSELLENQAVVVGANNLADNLYNILKNDLTSFSFNANLKDDSVWGAETCSSCHTDLVRLKQGKVTTQVLLANAPCTTQYRDGSTKILEQIDVINRLVKKYPEELELVLTAEGINNVTNDGKIGILIAAGAGYAIDSRIGLLRILYELGVRYMSLTPGCNTPWISGNVQPNENITFTDFGEEIIYEMNRLGIIVDLSGSSHDAANRVLAVTKAPVIFSKSGVQAISNHSQNVYDDTLTLLKSNGGLIMVNFDDENIAYEEGNFTLDHVIEHIEYVVKTIGYDYIGIGGNFDTTNNLPADLEDISGLPLLLKKLRDKGWSENNLNKLAAENFLRVFQEVENVKQSMATADVCQTWINVTDFTLTGVNSQVWQCRTRT